MPEVIARLQIAPVRRWAIVVMLVLIGAGLIYSGLAVPSDSMLARAAIVVLGGLLILHAYRTSQLGNDALILTEDGLWVEGGPQLAALDDIEMVQVGAFTIKPSNGFALVLENPVPAKWVPGLYWCVGRRIGVGGATQPAQAKAMAEMISARIGRQ